MTLNFGYAAWGPALFTPVIILDQRHQQKKKATQLRQSGYECVLCLVHRCNSLLLSAFIVYVFVIYKPPDHIILSYVQRKLSFQTLLSLKDTK